MHGVTQSASERFTGSCCDVWLESSLNGPASDIHLSDTYQDMSICAKTYVLASIQKIISAVYISFANTIRQTEIDVNVANIWQTSRSNDSTLKLVAACTAASASAIDRRKLFLGHARLCAGR